MKALTWIFLSFSFFLFSCENTKSLLRKIKTVTKGGASKKALPLDQKNYGPTLNSSKRKFKDKTKKYKLDGLSAVGLYAVDFNNDFFTDLVILPEYPSTPLFFQYDKKSRSFEKIASPYKTVGKFSSLSFVDINNDFVLDMIASNVNAKKNISPVPISVFKGELKDGRYSLTQISTQMGQGTFSVRGMIPVDINLDGRIDFFQPNLYKSKGDKKQYSPDKIWINEGKDKFRSADYLLENEYVFFNRNKLYPNAAPTNNGTICDVDQNGYPDILTSSSVGHPNKLWLNSKSSLEEGRVFKNIGKNSSYAHDIEGSADEISGGNTLFSACADYNNDERIDIFLGELSHSYDSINKDRSSVLTGKNKYSPVSFIRTEYFNDDGSSSWSQADQRASWADFDNDGLLDLQVDNSGFPPKSKLILFQQKKDHSYDDFATLWGLDIVNPVGTVVIDVNLDGKLDLITSSHNVRDKNIKPRVYVFENHLSLPKSRSLKFFLRGRKSNTYALGAMSILKTNANTYRRYSHYNIGSVGGQNEEGAHFGLPKHEKVISLEVLWPSKKPSGAVHRQYFDLSSFRFKSNNVFTICEGKKVQKGRQKCLR
jgi:enediyne biosynthesis protein E4